jgi:hypothetical protein
VVAVKITHDEERAWELGQDNTKFSNKGGIWVWDIDGEKSNSYSLDRYNVHPRGVGRERNLGNMKRAFDKEG